MKIYELVFYWEDIYNGGEEVESSYNHYIYAYKNNNVKTFIDGWSNLKIFEHDKIN